MAGSVCRISQEYSSLFQHSDSFDLSIFTVMHRLSYGAIMRTELFMYFIFKKGEELSTVKVL